MIAELHCALGGSENNSLGSELGLHRWLFFIPSIVCIIRKWLWTLFVMAIILAPSSEIVDRLKSLGTAVVDSSWVKRSIDAGLMLPITEFSL